MSSVIYVVDDDVHVLKGFERTLIRHHPEWQFQLYDCPMRALKESTQHIPDVIMSDMHMPMMSGIDLIAHLKQERPHLPSILLTGVPDLNVALESINRVGITRFFLKPTDSEQIAASITNLLMVSRQREEELQQKRINASPSRECMKPQTLFGNMIGDVLNQLKLCVIVVDAEARTVYLNESAQCLIQSHDGLSCGATGNLRAHWPEQTRTLHQSIRAIAYGDAPCLKRAEHSSTLHASDRFSSLSLSRPSGKRQLCISLVPLVTEHQPHVAVFIVDPEENHSPSPQTLSRLFSLSETESSLLHAFASGAGLEEAAEQSGITLSTARTYLKHVFAKTDTNRQPELMRLICKTPAGLLRHP